jgi:hypothetical protein
VTATRISDRAAAIVRAAKYSAAQTITVTARASTVANGLPGTCDFRLAAAFQLAAGGFIEL